MDQRRRGQRRHPRAAARPVVPARPGAPRGAHPGQGRRRLRRGALTHPGATQPVSDGAGRRLVRPRGRGRDPWWPGAQAEPGASGPPHRGGATAARGPQRGAGGGRRRRRAVERRARAGPGEPRPHPAGPAVAQLPRLPVNGLELARLGDGAEDFPGLSGRLGGGRRLRPGPAGLGDRLGAADAAVGAGQDPRPDPRRPPGDRLPAGHRLVRGVPPA